MHFAHNCPWIVCIVHSSACGSCVMYTQAPVDHVIETLAYVDGVWRILKRCESHATHT